MFVAHIDLNYRIITLIITKHGNLPFLLQNDATFLYTYALINILYLGELPGNLNFKLPWHIYIHFHAWILSFIYFFLPNIIAKYCSFFTNDAFFSSWHDNFSSCNLLQVNRCQNKILYLTMKKMCLNRNKDWFYFIYLGWWSHYFCKAL